MVSWPGFGQHLNPLGPPWLGVQAAASLAPTGPGPSACWLLAPRRLGKWLSAWQLCCGHDAPFHTFLQAPLLLCFLPSLLLCTLKITVFFLFEQLLTPVPHRPWGRCTSPSGWPGLLSDLQQAPPPLCGWMMSLSHRSPDFDFKHQGREWVACGCSPAPQKTRLTPTQRMQFPPEEFTLCDLPALCFSVSPPDQRVYILAHTFPGPLETKRTGFSMVLLCLCFHYLHYLYLCV